MRSNKSGRVIAGYRATKIRVIQLPLGRFYEETNLFRDMSLSMFMPSNGKDVLLLSPTIIGSVSFVMKKKINSEQKKIPRTKTSPVISKFIEKNGCEMDKRTKIERERGG